MDGAQLVPELSAEGDGDESDSVELTGELEGHDAQSTNFGGAESITNGKETARLRGSESA